MSEALQRTPLHARHAAAGATLVPFAGFEMPVSYTSIVDEHRAVRERAGLFDVSHMGELRLRGPAALEQAQRLYTNDVAGTAVGRVRYGLLCRPDGGVIDDVTLYRLGDDELLFVVNASNIAADRDWLEQHVGGVAGCELRDESADTALLALQGPAALEIARELLEEPERRGPGRWRHQTRRLAGVEVMLSRTGYTGEDGYEIYAPAADAARLWDALLETGGDRIVPVGLGARDTLRTEVAFSLYGHELDLEHTPVEAGLERFLALDHDFVGRDVLREQLERGPQRRLVGLELEGRRVARTGFAIRTPDGDGTVTSGTWGPSVERSIAIGYVPAASAKVGTALEVDVRGRGVPCQVVDTPFYGR